MVKPWRSYSGFDFGINQIALETPGVPFRFTHVRRTRRRRVPAVPIVRIMTSTNTTVW